MNKAIEFTADGVESWPEVPFFRRHYRLSFSEKNKCWHFVNKINWLSWQHIQCSVFRDPQRLLSDEHLWKNKYYNVKCYFTILVRIFAYGKDREVCTQCEADMLAWLKRCGLVTFERSFSKGNYFSLLSSTQLFSFQTFWRHSDLSVITMVHSIIIKKKYYEWPFIRQKM